MLAGGSNGSVNTNTGGGNGNVSTNTGSGSSGGSSSSGSSSGGGSSGGGIGRVSPNTVGGFYGGGNGSANTGGGNVEPNTSVEDGYKASMDAANDRLKQAYEYQQGQLSKAKDGALREAYIKQQMVERGYPEQLSALGINGGAAQGLIARNNADYANQRTAVYGDYMNNLGEAGQNYQQGVMQNNSDYLAQMAAYNQQLDMMRRQWELEQLEKSGLLNKNNMGYNYGNIMERGYTPMTAQDYLNNLRANYGNLFG